MTLSYWHCILFLTIFGPLMAIPCHSSCDNPADEGPPFEAFCSPLCLANATCSYDPPCGNLEPIPWISCDAWPVDLSACPQCKAFGTRHPADNCPDSVVTCNLPFCGWDCYSTEPPKPGCITACEAPECNVKVLELLEAMELYKFTTRIQRDNSLESPSTGHEEL